MSVDVVLTESRCHELIDPETFGAELLARLPFRLQLQRHLLLDNLGNPVVASYRCLGTWRPYLMAWVDGSGARNRWLAFRVRRRLVDEWRRSRSRPLGSVLEAAPESGVVLVDYGPGCEVLGRWTAQREDLPRSYRLQQIL